MTDASNPLSTAEKDALAALIRTVPIGPFGPNAKALINMGQTTLLTPYEAERLAEVLIEAGWTPPETRPLPPAGMEADQ
jgi:hypothetical protein